MKCSFSDGLPEDQQKTTRRLPEDCQKTTRRPLAVFWQSSNTMIQGNFYKRLHFYMDSCAISPMASLFVEYTEKETSVYQQFCTKPSEQGSFFQAGRNESEEWYAMIETYEKRNINSSAQNLQNRACFPEPVEMSPRSGMLQSKLTKT